MESLYMVDIDPMETDELSHTVKLALNRGCYLHIELRKIDSAEAREGYRPGDATTEPGREPITLPRDDVAALFAVLCDALEVNQDRGHTNPDLIALAESVEEALGYKR